MTYRLCLIDMNTYLAAQSLMITQELCKLLTQLKGWAMEYLLLSFFNMSIMIRDYFAALYNGYSICYLPESDLGFMKLVLIEWIFSVFLSSVLFLFASILCLFFTVSIMSCCDKLAFILFVGLWVE